MAETTKIEWADATFNPWLGCTKVSPACDNCYAEALVQDRFKIAVWGAKQPRQRTSDANWKQPLKWNRLAALRQSAWECGKAIAPGMSDADLVSRGFIKPEPMRVFCGSLCDVFDNEVPNQWRDDLFHLIWNTPNLQWMLLTKRIGNVKPILGEYWPNLAVGITVVNQSEADRDIPKLLSVPAAKRFVSIEPMLGPIDIRTWLDDGSNEMAFAGSLDLVICGGEASKNARPLHPDWVRSLRDQCAEAGTAFHFKQWGDWFPRSQWEFNPELILPDDECTGWPDSNKLRNIGNETFHRVGKKAAGRMLDGREWNGALE